jgi:phospholipid/cholesterol/gamma-HCH transport system ATP-binding protein
MSCRMRKGGIHLLLGGSGTGKSTLLRMIGGLQRPDSGDVRVAGHLLSEKSERELGEIRKGIGMLFQNGALLDSMTVLENVGLPLREHMRKSWADIATHVARVLKSVGLEGVEGLLPRQLSGGMLRRVAFARAIVMEPEILLCDEPFSGLDPVNVSRIEDLLVELNRALGLTIVVTSHHMASSLRMAHQMILLRRGGCIAGSPEDLASSTDAEVTELPRRGRPQLSRAAPRAARRERHMTGWIRELGAQATAGVAGLGRIARFGGHLIGVVPRSPTRFGFFVRCALRRGCAVGRADLSFGLHRRHGSLAFSSIRP